MSKFFGNEVSSVIQVRFQRLRSKIIKIWNRIGTRLQRAWVVKVEKSGW